MYMYMYYSLQSELEAHACILDFPEILTFLGIDGILSSNSTSSHHIWCDIASSGLASDMWSTRRSGILFSCVWTPDLI